MGDTTTIEWCDKTFNPWIGCTKVSAGCTHCYAEQLMDKRYGRVVWGKGNPRQLTSVGNWRKPKQWNKEAEKSGIRYRVFCASLADVFDAEVPDEWRERLFELIYDTPHLDWLLLTKRPERVLEFMDKACFPSSGCPMFLDLKMPPNVWMGTSVEHQRAANERIPHLLAIPATVRFLSCEPLLGAVNLGLNLDEHHDPTDPAFDGYCEQHEGYLHHRDCPNFCDYACGGTWYKGEKPIHWVIAGGESGAGARPMHPDWARGLRDQCQAAGVAYLFKQWGEWLPIATPRMNYKGERRILSVEGETRHSVSWADVMAVRGKDWAFEKVGKHAAGRHLDQRTWDGYPQPQQAVTT